MNAARPHRRTQRASNLWTPGERERRRWESGGAAQGLRADWTATCFHRSIKVEKDLRDHLVQPSPCHQCRPLNFWWVRTKEQHLPTGPSPAQLPSVCCASSRRFLPGAWLAFVTEAWILQMSVTHMGEGSGLQPLLIRNLPKNINNPDFLTPRWPQGEQREVCPSAKGTLQVMPAVKLYKLFAF